MFAVLFLFIGFIFLLSARSGLLSLAICGIFFAINDLIINFSKTKAVIYISILIFSIILLLSLSYTRKRIILTYNTLINGYNLSQEHSANLRLITWDAAIKAIKEKPLFGHGIDERKEKLLQKFQELNFKKGLAENYNTHNQWLQILLTFGIFGMLYFLAILLYPLIIIKNKKILILYLLFVILISINFSTENILSRQKGLIFFIFFYCLIINLYYTKRMNKVKKEKNI
ncbi:MAG: O-antigen ligase family protein [Candidatus Cyclobacteriaceae bacterium M2_1C_046]